MEDQVEQRHAVRRQAAGQRAHVLERRVGRPQPAARARAQLPQHALRLVRLRGARPRPAPAPAASADAAPPRAAAPARARSRRAWRGRRPGSTASAARRRSRGRPCAPRRTAGDARVDEIAGLLERRHVRRREPEAAGAIGHRPGADGSSIASSAPELRIEALGRQVERVEMPLQILRRRGRRLPGVMVGANLAVCDSCSARSTSADRGSLATGHVTT